MQEIDYDALEKAVKDQYKSQPPPGLIHDPDPNRRPPTGGMSFKEVVDSGIQHLPEALPLAASFLPGGLPLRMGMTGAAGLIGNLMAGKGIGPSAEQGAMDATMYSAAPAAAQHVLEYLGIPQNIVSFGMRGKIADPAERTAASQAIIDNNINSAGKATKLGEQALQDTTAEAKKVSSLRQRNPQGQMTSMPKVYIDPTKLGQDAVKAVEDVKKVTPRVPLDPADKAKTTRVVGNLMGDQSPRKITDAVADYRAMGTRGGDVYEATQGAVKSGIDQAAPTVGKLLDRESAIGSAADAFQKTPAPSIWEAGPAIGGAVGGALSGHPESGAIGGMAMAALMHALRSPSAWANAGLAAKGVVKATPALMRGTTFAVRDRGPLQDLLGTLTKDDGQ